MHIDGQLKDLEQETYWTLKSWIKNKKRKPANEAFTAGELRAAAYAIEDSGILK